MSGRSKTYSYTAERVVLTVESCTFQVDVPDYVSDETAGKIGRDFFEVRKSKMKWNYARHIPESVQKEEVVSHEIVTHLEDEIGDIPNGIRPTRSRANG